MDSLSDENKTSSKGFSAFKCDVGNWIFSQSWEFFEKLFGNFMDFFGSLLRIFWEFLGGIFWEKCFGRNSLGGFFWEDFFGRIFFGRNSLGGILCLRC